MIHDKASFMALRVWVVQMINLTRSKEKKLAIDVCVIHFTLIKSMPSGMQRIEEAKLVTAGQDFTT